MYIKYLNTVVFFIVLASVSVAAMHLFAPFTGAILVAAIFAILFHHPYTVLVKKWGGRTYLAAITMCIAVALTIVLPLVMTGALVVSEANDILQKVAINKEQISSIQVRVEKMMVTFPGIVTEDILSEKSLSDAFQQIGKGALTLAQKTYNGIVGMIVGIFILFFTLFFFFVDGEKIMRKIMFISPLRDQHEMLLFQRFVSISRATIKGTLVIGVIQGAIAGLVFWIAGVPSVMIWTIIMTIFAIIPMIGSGIVGFPVGIFYFVIGEPIVGTMIIVAFSFISLLDNYLRPILVGKDAQMHTLLVFFATFGGIVSFGLAGFIIGPIIMALFITLWEIYALEFREQLEEYNA